MGVPAVVASRFLLILIVRTSPALLMRAEANLGVGSGVLLVTLSVVNESA